jgi:hypothetical protein
MKSPPDHSDVTSSRPPAPTPAVVQPLEYDRTPAVTRRQFRVLMALTLLNTILLGWFVVGPQATQALQSQWKQWQARREAQRQQREFQAAQAKCLVHTYPADTVAYTEEPAMARKLLDDRTTHSAVDARNNPIDDLVPPAQRVSPAEWRELARASKGGVGMPGPVLYLGDRRTPAGERRLVVVTFGVKRLFNNSPTSDMQTSQSSTSRMLSASTFDPTGGGMPGRATRQEYLELSGLPEVTAERRYSRGPAGPWVIQHPRAPLTVFAGQSDPADPTRFVIPYRLGSETGAIDGKLTEDGIRLTPRSGRLRYSGDGPGWDLSPPATQEAAP